MDGIVLKTRTGYGAKKKTVLVAYGIRIDGKRELIDFLVTKHESEKHWEGFLNNLYHRGLAGESLGLVTTELFLILFVLRIPIDSVRRAKFYYDFTTVGLMINLPQLQFYPQLYKSFSFKRKI